jgi:3-deoxy-D-manno-octulosonic-acid transferase
MAVGQQSNSAAQADGWLQRLLLGAYVVAWHVGLPLVLGYFWLRGRKEPLYRKFLAERFGRLACRVQDPVWVHSASLGELRGVMPLIDVMLENGLGVFITTLTPAGRQAAEIRYANAIAHGKLQVSYLPLELPWAVRRFASAMKPRCMLSSEIDTWPVLLDTLKSLRIPLGFVNAQYPQKSYDKDLGGLGLRARAFRQYDIVLCKSGLHAQRFLATGCANVQIAGELRFDLPAPPAQLQAAAALRAQLPHIFGERSVVCIASVIEGEDEWLRDAFVSFSEQMAGHAGRKPLLIYVPRNPQRFDAVAQLLKVRGLRYARRSVALDHALNWVASSEADIDVLLGDSLGEMYFYLALADIVTVCGSFMPSGSHNVIEPLALCKPVFVGPSIWGIEYPGQEALAAGVLTQVQNADELPARWLQWFTQNETKQQSKMHASAFMAEHAGAVNKHWLLLSQWLSAHE